MKAAASISLAVLELLTGCASIQQAINGYEAVAAVSLRAAEDNNISVWTFNACATPYSAALRNPQIIPALRVLCGQSTLFGPPPATAYIPPLPSDQVVPK